jgi:hypothetical protein
MIRLLYTDLQDLLQAPIKAFLSSSFIGFPLRLQTSSYVLCLALLGVLYASPKEIQAQALQEVQRGLEWIEFEVQNSDGVLSVPLSTMIDQPVQGDIEVLSQTRMMPAQNRSELNRSEQNRSEQNFSAIKRKAEALGITASLPLAEIIPFEGEHSELRVSLWNGASTLANARIRVFLEPEQSTGMRFSGRTLGARQQTDSPLATGTWIRFGIQESGLYQLSPSELTEASASFTGISSDQLQCWGRPGTELPDVNTAPRISFQQLPLRINDGGDGIFDSNDQAWVYVEGFMTALPKRIFIAPLMGILIQVFEWTQGARPKHLFERRDVNLYGLKRICANQRIKFDRVDSGWVRRFRPQEPLLQRVFYRWTSPMWLPTPLYE